MANIKKYTEEERDVMREYLHDRFDREYYDEIYGLDRAKDEEYDEALSELEEREYWRNVLDNEPRR